MTKQSDWRLFGSGADVEHVSHRREQCRDQCRDQCREHPQTTDELQRAEQRRVPITIPPILDSESANLRRRWNETKEARGQADDELDEVENEVQEELG